MFYISALIAILGAVFYQVLVKRVPVTISPFVSVLGLYLSVLAMTVVLLLIFPPEGGLMKHVRQLSWVQVGLAVTVLLIEVGFILMYRYGWNLSTGNLVTGVVVNVALVAIGTLILGEKVNWVNLLGIALSIAGVALISYKP